MIDSVIKRFLVTGSIRVLAMYKVFLCFFRDPLRLSPNGARDLFTRFLGPAWRLTCKQNSRKRELCVGVVRQVCSAWLTRMNKLALQYLQDLENCASAVHISCQNYWVSQYTVRIAYAWKYEYSKDLSRNIHYSLITAMKQVIPSSFNLLCWLKLISQKLTAIMIYR